MALSYTQIPTLATNTIYLNQVQMSVLKYAITRIQAACTGAELAFCAAVVRNPSGYSTRFLLDALILNQAGLTSTNGTSLDVAPTDAAIDSAVAAEWQAQISAGA